MPDSLTTTAPRRLNPVPHTRVTFHAGFWAERTRVNREVTIPTQFQRLEEEGFIEVLDVDQPPKPLVRPINEYGLSMQMFFDSDFGKWIEAASYSLATHPDPAIEAKIDFLVEKLDHAQLADGYLNSWFIRRDPEKRWTNLRDWHEMYSMGHLVEGAVAYFQATGKRRFLDVMIRCVDHIASRFGREPGKLRGYDAHEEIELALVKLFRATGEPRFLDLARYFIDERGTQDPHFFDEEARSHPGGKPFNFGTYEYSQSHRPVREQDQVVGHAVRAMYLYSAMADLAAEDGDVALKAALDKLWKHLTGRQLYVTGGMGPAVENEGFTRAFDLPNETAYAETCAAVSLVFWAHRMAAIDLDARYADHMELALHNGALSGVSLAGDRYFYENPLESHGQHRRWLWHYCPCCPTNLARLVASLGGYIASRDDENVAIHLYAASTIDFDVGGRALRLTQQTAYPWDGDIRITVGAREPVPATLWLRIPGWCRKATVTVNGESVDVAGATRKGYCGINRRWEEGDEIRLALDMPVERLRAHPDVGMDADRVALRRGPVVYCVEETDNPAPPQHMRLLGEAAEVRDAPDLLGGIVTLAVPATIDQTADWRDTLYRPEPAETVRGTLTAIPYFAWANREPGAMQVWLRAGR